MSNSESESQSKKPATQGLAGVKIDPDNMSPKVKEKYKDYQAIANDDDAPNHELALKNAEHALREVINEEVLAEELKKKSNSEKGGPNDPGDG